MYFLFRRRRSLLSRLLLSIVIVSVSLNVVSVGIGMGIGIAIALATLIYSLFKGEDAPDNPWGASTLDWQCQSPPVHENFEEDPVLKNDPYYYN